MIDVFLQCLQIVFVKRKLPHILIENSPVEAKNNSLINTAFNFFSVLGKGVTQL